MYDMDDVIDAMMNADLDGGCEATDGCWVELDGVCPHGRPSIVLAAGLI